MHYRGFIFSTSNAEGKTAHFINENQILLGKKYDDHQGMRKKVVHLESIKAPYGRVGWGVGVGVSNYRDTSLAHYN